MCGRTQEHADYHLALDLSQQSTPAVTNRFPTVGAARPWGAQGADAGGSGGGGGRGIAGKRKRNGRGGSMSHNRRAGPTNVCVGMHVWMYGYVCGCMHVCMYVCMYK